MRFYLSGGMEFKENLGEGWRKTLTEILNGLGHESFDPVLEELSNQEARDFCWKEAKLAPDLFLYREMVRKHMFAKDMLGIQGSDACVLLYDESVRRGAGSLAEAWECFREGKPVYVVTDFPRAEIPGWLIGESTRIFNKLEEFITYATEPSRIACDIELAEEARDKHLKGVY